jgi:RNA polymerase sigma-70 factor (ECF subfamily)
MTKRAVVVPIDQARPASSASFGEAVLEHLDGLYRFALRLTRDGHRAQELTQECALRALERQKTITCDLRAWLFQTLYHTFVSHYRRGLRQETSSKHSAEFQPLQRSPSNPLLSLIAVEDVRNAIEALPEELRTVVWLSDAEDFRLREIAQILEWPLGTVASRLWRARQGLRRLLVDYSPPKENQS